VPACIGFGEMDFSYPDGTIERFVGGPSSAVTWQGAYVAGFAPVPGHMEGTGYSPYHGYLDCATGPVPTRNQTWGTIKTLYR